MAKFRMWETWQERGFSFFNKEMFEDGGERSKRERKQKNKIDRDWDGEFYRLKDTQ